MIILYELFIQSLDIKKCEIKQTPSVFKDMEESYAHIEKVLEEIDFFEGKVHKYVLNDIKRFFSRNPMSEYENKILRGILHKIEMKIKQNKEK
jgi:tRNA C32,U32 (ribose-2'-O)-methylase TrmJ